MDLYDVCAMPTSLSMPHPLSLQVYHCLVFLKIGDSGIEMKQNQVYRLGREDNIEMTQNQVYGLGGEAEGKIEMTQNQGYGAFQSESRHEQNLYEVVDDETRSQSYAIDSDAQL